MELHREDWHSPCIGYAHPWSNPYSKVLFLLQFPEDRSLLGLWSNVPLGDYHGELELESFVLVDRSGRRIKWWGRVNLVWKQVQALAFPKANHYGSLVCILPSYVFCVVFTFQCSWVSPTIDEITSPGQHSSGFSCHGVLALSNRVEYKRLCELRSLYVVVLGAVTDLFTVSYWSQAIWEGLCFCFFLVSNWETHSIFWYIFDTYLDTITVCIKWLRVV